MISQIALPQFTTAQVAQAAGIPEATLQYWMSRNVLLIGSEGADRAITSPSRGQTRLWSVRRAMQVAIAAELTSLGLPVARAAEAAVTFTDMGDTQAGWVGEEVSEPAPRMPCELYAEGETFLIVASPSDKGGQFSNVEVFNAKEKNWTFDQLQSIFPHQTLAAAFVVLNLNDLALVTLARLGVDRDMLYPSQFRK